MRKLFALSLIAALAVGGCSLFQGEDETVTPTAPISTPERQPTPNPSPVTTPEIDSPEAAALNVWILPDFEPGTGNPGSRLLSELLEEFDSDHPDISLNVDVRSSAGQGGSLNYLRTGRDVAPDALPHLILLETDHLSAAAAEELIYPLNDLLDSALVDDLFPAARSLGRVGGDLYGYPMALSNFQNAVFNTTVLSDTLPATWDELVQIDDALFVFPAAGQEGAQLALLFYLDAGGQLSDEANQPTLEIEPLTEALNRFTRGRNAAMITPASLSLTSLTDVWNYYTNSISNVAQSNASIILSERDPGDGNGFAPIPGGEQPLAPLVEGWAWAISSPEPAHQAQGAQLISWLTAPENMGEWSSRSLLIPSRRSALETWDVEDDYVKFLQEQLPLAQPYPGGASSEVMSALSEAVFNVLSRTKSPQTAAEEAAATLGE